MIDAVSVETGVPLGDLTTRKSGRPFRFVCPFLITNIIGNDEMRVAIQGIGAHTRRLVCRQCKLRSIPAPGTASKDRKTCLCGDCERWRRLEDGLRFDARWLRPDRSDFGITSAPGLDAESGLDKARPFEFEEQFPRDFTRLLIRQLVRVEGKSQAEAERITQRELRRLLKDLNADGATERKEADQELRRLYLKKWRDILPYGEPPELPRIPARDKSASTRRTYDAMQATEDRLNVLTARADRRRALSDILSSPEFAGVFSRAEADLFQAYMLPRRGWPPSMTATEWIWHWHTAWCCGRFQYSEVDALLDEDNPQSLLARLWRQWHAIERKGRVSDKLREAVCALLARDDPQEADVSEVNTRIFATMGSDGGDEFPLGVRACPWFCWQQNITHRNIETAYGDGSVLALHHRERIEWFARMGKGKDAHCDRLSSLRDRVCAPETLTLSYSQSGRGFGAGIAPATESADLSDTAG
jgi:hypothetical protein